MTAAALVLAHQGGWDEILLILTPIAIFAALLGLANRRANTAVRQRADPATIPVDRPDEGDDAAASVEADADTGGSGPDGTGPGGTEAGEADAG